MLNAENILVHLPNWVGDAVMATPILRALRLKYPSSKITYIGKPITLQTVGMKFCDFQISLESKKIGYILKKASELRKQKFDLGILLPNSLRSAMLFALGRVKNRIGYKRDGRGFLLNDSILPPKDSSGNYKPYSAVWYYRDLLEHIDIKCDSLELEIPTDKNADSQAEKLLLQTGFDSTKKLVMLNPGASNNFHKRWLPERFAQVADNLIEKKSAQVIINAAPGEEALAKSLEKSMTHKPILNMADQKNSIPLLKSLIKKSEVLLTNDTGARHIAAALGIGVVTIFISTDPIWAQIDCPREKIVTINKPFEDCKNDTILHKKFLEGVTVEMVTNAALELWQD